MLGKFIREPLVHFLGGALLVFAFFWATGADRDPADYRISIDQTDIERLTSDWIRNFRRPPTEKEMDGLIDQEIAEEIYYREALRLGLDKDDPVIRRRLFTKMRFIDSENAETAAPTDAILQRWLEEHPEKYALSPLYDFEQIYLGQITAEQANERIERLKDGARPADLARSISLPETIQHATIAEISRQFGDEFAGALDQLPTGQWAGPVASGFGMHAVQVTEKTPGETPALADIRQQVANDWLADQRTAQKEQALADYRSQYEVTVAGRP